MADQDEWTLSTSLHLILAILGWQVLTVVGLLLVGGVFRVFLPEMLVIRWGGPVAFVTLELVWLLVLGHYRWRSGVKPLWQEEELRDWRFWCLLGAAVCLCVGANLTRLWLAEGSVRLSAGDLTAGLGPVSLGPSLAIIAAAVGLAPVAEEWFFRGVVQGALTRRWGAWLAIPVTALVFGALHGLSDIWVVAVYGLVFGLLAHRRHSLTLSILVHAAVNLVALGVPLAIQLAH